MQNKGNTNKTASSEVIRNDFSVHGWRGSPGSGRSRLCMSRAETGLVGAGEWGWGRRRLRGMWKAVTAHTEALSLYIYILEQVGRSNHTIGIYSVSGPAQVPSRVQ